MKLFVFFFVVIIGLLLFMLGVFAENAAATHSCDTRGKFDTSRGAYDCFLDESDR